jgi:hypothetical protein
MNHYDPTQYQGTDSEGDWVLVSRLSKEELQQNLCMAMHALERVENSMAAISGVIEDWRDDTLKPESEE